MSKCNNNHSTFEYCTVALCFLQGLVACNTKGSVTVVLLPLQTKK